METRSFIVSNSPHVHNNSSVNKIMWNVFLALIPASFVSVYAFGFDSLRVLGLSMASAIFFEYVALLFMNRDWRACFDGSAAVTGLLLGLTLPSNLSGGIIIIGSFVAIIVAKQVFGGLGHNPFNPALTARVFLLIAFPGPLTSWPLPRGLVNATKYMGIENAPDAIAGATPLGAIKQHALEAIPNIQMNDLLFGLQTPGSIGEISAIALLLGAGWLLYKKIISWHIPVAIFGSVLLVSLITWGINPKKYADPFFHFFAGGLVIGAFFMATDYVTAPIFSMGKIIYGIGIGLLTIAIRLWGGYPEGVSFAILLMNALTPLLDRWTVPKPFGYRKVRGKS
jgi:H+/Na+-translocating ferredoxin:NAD+ oxidoreductase subunit D